MPWAKSFIGVADNLVKLIGRVRDNNRLVNYLAASAAQLLYSASILSMRNYLIPQRRRGAKKKE